MSKFDKNIIKLSIFISILIGYNQPILAMHIMEGYLPIGYCIFWYALCLPFLIGGLIRIKNIVNNNRRSITLLALAGAFIFVISALKIPSITGSCSHMTGTGLGAILFGPLPMSVLSLIVLLFQCLFLAHGGLTTLGANLFAAGIAGPFLAYFLYSFGKKHKWNNKLNIFIACCFGDLLTYCVTSLQLAIAYPAENGGILTSALTFLGIFSLTQIPLAIIEGLISVVIIISLESYAAPELKAINFDE